VVSSIANRRPSRPKPESFEPPYGIWSARKAETSFTITPPTSISRCAWKARLMSFVNTPACRPKRESFTTRIASSKVWYGLIVTTGPKISSRQTFISGFTWDSRVGW
jgi:hypothetical protein